jgi:hypothetical protein
VSSVTPKLNISPTRRDVLDNSIPLTQYDFGDYPGFPKAHYDILHCCHYSSVNDRWRWIGRCKIFNMVHYSGVFSLYLFTQVGTYNIIPKKLKKINSLSLVQQETFSRPYWVL